MKRKYFGSCHVSAFVTEVVFVALASKGSERNDYIGVFVNKVTVEMVKPRNF